METLDHHVTRPLKEPPGLAPALPAWSTEEALDHLAALRTHFSGSDEPRRWKHFLPRSAAPDLQLQALAALDAGSTPRRTLPSDTDVLAAMARIEFHHHDLSFYTYDYPTNLVLTATAALHGRLRAAEVVLRLREVDATNAALRFDPGARLTVAHARFLAGLNRAATPQERVQLVTLARRQTHLPVESKADLARALELRTWHDELLAQADDPVGLAAGHLDFIADDALLRRAIRRRLADHKGYAYPEAIHWPHRVGLDKALPHLRRLIAGSQENALHATRALTGFDGVEVSQLLADALEVFSSKELAEAHLRAHPRAAMEGIATLESPQVAALALLRDLAHQHPELARALPLGPIGRRRIADALPESPGETAAASAVPDVLARPPWRDKKKRHTGFPGAEVEPVHLPLDLGWSEADRQSHTTDTRWDRPLRPGEEGLLVQELIPQTDANIARALRDMPIRWRASWEEHAALIARAPDAVISRMIADHPQQPSPLYPPLLQVGATEAGPILLEAFRQKNRRPLVEDWTARFPRHAAHVVVPLAVADGAPDHAREWLALVHEQHPDALAEALDRYGEPARALAERILAFDPEAALPAKIPRLPGFLDLDALPPVTLRAGGDLPAKARKALLELCSLAELAPRYAGFDQVLDACDPESLRRFSWAVFLQWHQAGAAGKASWCLRCLGPFGDSELVGILGRAAMTWPSQKASARAVHALYVLERIGTDEALGALYRISQKARTKGLKEEATRRIQAAARARGLTDESLADRCVPTLGLDAPEDRILDFGPRQFTVDFDETLTPVLRDGAGKRLRGTPRPSQSDDPDLAELAAARFKALKKQAKAIASEQVRRLERMMVDQRLVTAAEFQAYFVDHPVTSTLASRLVWAIVGDDGPVGTCFITAEREVVDVDDAPVDLTGRRLTVAHPVLLDAPTLAAWSDVFADFELIQPFAQLGRPTLTPTPAELLGHKVIRWADRTASSGALRSLLGKGFKPLDYDQYGFTGVQWDVGDGVFAQVFFEPWVATGENEQHTAGPLALHRVAAEVPWSEVSPVVFSEAVGLLAGCFG